MGSSSAAKKAWASRRRGKSSSKPSKAKRAKTKSKKKGKKGKGMPENVKQYFRYLNQDLSKAEAREKAGLPPPQPRKKWGPYQRITPRTSPLLLEMMW